MSQKNNVIIQNIKDLENLIQTGLVKPDDYINDLNTLRRIQDNINQDNIKQCRLLSKQLKGFSSEALKQIDEKGYLIPYTLDGRKLVKVGVNFSKETRNIDEYIVVEE